MACSKQAGPQAYLTYLEETTGHAITQAEWHELREMAHEKAVRAEYDRLSIEQRNNGLSTYTEEELWAQAEETAARSFTRERVDSLTAANAAENLANAVSTATVEGVQRKIPTSELKALKDNMLHEAMNVNVTKSTVATLDNISRLGFPLSVKEAQARIRNKSLARAEKAAVQKAADTHENPLMAAGLDKAAGLLSDKGDAEVIKWHLSGNMDKEYPGLWDEYQNITRGDVETRRFGMQSRKGNEAVLAATRGLQERIIEGGLSRDDVESTFYVTVGMIEKNHPEVVLNKPRHSMMAELDETFDAMGWKRIDW